MRIRDPKKQIYITRNPSAHGGAFQTTRRGRARRRPLSKVQSMHLTLRASKAKGAWSFRQPHHQTTIKTLIKRFAQKHGIHVYSSANVGNHLHLHVQLGRNGSYNKFIRALTAAIAMAVTGASRWNKPAQKIQFWDRRPFTRLVQDMKGFLRLEDYVAVNVLEGDGFPREAARRILEWRSRFQPLPAG